MAACLLLASLPALSQTSFASPVVNRQPISHSGSRAENLAAQQLAAVELAWDELAAARASRSQITVLAARKKYRDALETFLGCLTDLKKLQDWKGTIALTHGGRRYNLEIPSPPAGYTQYNITTFDSFRISSQVVAKCVARPCRVEGIGAPVVLRRQSRGEPFVYRTGTSSVATAVIDFQKTGTGTVRATLRFYDPREQTSWNGYVLAADYAAPVETNVYAREFRSIMLGGVFKADKFMTVRGLYLMEPYRPDKIPVVFVHGLQSSPLTWAQMINSLNADPEISRKYQFWYYAYPTAAGWAISAADFRADLNRAHAHFSAMGGRNSLNRTILVGHSMGGVMSHMMTIDSGDAFWDMVFHKPPSQVSWPNTEARDRFMRTLYFKRVPMVSAAVFIAAPHRGSQMADLLIVSWIKKLIKLPANVAGAMVDVATMNLDAVKINLSREFGTGTSASGLSPNNPAYKAMNSRVIQVPFYTIIGDRRKGIDLLRFPDPLLLKGNDMVVPYWSSHLNEAVSEKIIRTGHSTCTSYAACVDEVRRILLERLSGKPAKAPSHDSNEAIAQKQ